MLKKVICDTYENTIRHKKENIGMYIPIRLNIDYTKEEGYKHLDILIVWSGYVGVFYKERKNIVPIEGIDFENDCLKDGYEYEKTEGEWKCISCPVSCWRTDVIQKLIFKYRNNFSGFNTICNWYKEIEISDKFNKQLKEIERKVN